MDNTKYSIEDPYKKFHIVDPLTGQSYGYLNRRLVEQQGVSDEELQNLKDLHVRLGRVYAQMRETDDVQLLRELAAECTDIEFEQQKNWHFSQDANFHNWYNVPKCLCPKIDNHDMKGTKYRYYSGDCPIHSKGE